jgi:hypothetical protein
VKRRPFEIALSVFAFSVTTELVCIKMLRGSLTDWLNHPHRHVFQLTGSEGGGQLETQGEKAGTD